MHSAPYSTDLTDREWAVLRPLLPPAKPGGRPRSSDLRLIVDAIFYVLRTGCQWQALDQTELYAHATAHDRFQTWVDRGVFLTLWHAGVQHFAELCGIEWDRVGSSGIEWDGLAMDRALTKAPLGGKKPGAIPPTGASPASNAACSRRGMGCRSA